MNKKFIGLVLFTLLHLLMYSQNGLIKGTLTENQDGSEVPMPFANVYLEGTTIGTTSDFDGNFSLKAPIGSYTLMCTFMGYEPVNKNIEITNDGEVMVRIAMKPEGIAIEGVEVIAKMNRESEMALIMEQKNASVAIEAIGASELSSKGVSDAASAVTKITGITKQEGSGVLNVRGLGDRYNTTTLNRLPLPTNNPVNKNIDLELFTTDILSNISIEKTFSASLYGDFGGANIDIASKRLTGDNFLSLEAKVGQNSTLIGLNNFVFVDGPNKSGFYSEEVPNIDNIREQQAYGFQNSWNPVTGKVLPNMGVTLTGGRKFETKLGNLNAFFTLGFDNGKKYTEREERIVGATGVALTDMKGAEYNYLTQSNGMLNLNYSIGKSEFYFNSLLLNTSAEEVVSLNGNIRDVGEDAFVRLSEFQRNMVLVNQLLGEHKFNKGIAVDWGFAFNNVKNTVPDRRQNQYTVYDSVTNTGEFDTEPVGANFRYYHEFSDNEWAINSSISKIFNKDNNGNYKHKASIGFSGKSRNRQFINYQFNHDIEEGIVLNVDDVDGYINESNYINDAFSVNIVEPRDASGEAQDGEEYNAKARANGIFGFWEYNINPKWLILLGLRGEQVFQSITTRANQITGIGSNVKTFEFSEFKLLPSLSVKYAVTENQNIRLAGSKTYTLPQLQEMPFMSFTGITEETYGNPYLQPSEVYNIDLKWELFPKGGLFSVASFYKRIIDPINKTTLAGTQSSYFTANNGDWAYVYGIELDAKKDLLSTEGKKLFVAGNLSIMDSRMELDGEKIRQETENNFNANFNDTISKLQGAAPVLANLSLGYSQKWAEVNSVSATLVYNYTSDRLYAIGQSGRGNEYEKAMNTLDLVVKSKFGRIGVDLAAKNLLNAEYVRMQENRVEENADHIIRKYKKGVNYSLSIKYNF